MNLATTVDAQIYNDPVTLATGTATFIGSAITFNGTVTGAPNDLIVNTTGTGRPRRRRAPRASPPTPTAPPPSAPP